ncbi:hypothetical protein [Cryobacterium sp. TMT4-10]|uniref:hypothetical protein n=1 Tax=Cryobacterium sp. TMT4-10 TaxID=1259256 RepID=UPI0010695211|nr:hypothetical protein [Cryobacterium sp. TMT4-10]TFD12517.1 hypothetical protein E3T42_14830 [Cryobacterium sp. TMT4-10]
MATYDSSGSNINRNIDDPGSVAGVPAGNGATIRDEGVRGDDGVRRDPVVGRDAARFGGIQWGSAFFGWLTATGTAVILTALFAAAGAAVGLGESDSADQAAGTAADNAGTIALIGAIVLAVVVFVSYLCGGYVAGRMARFDGIKQGIAVWVWAIVIAAVAGTIGVIAGGQLNILGNLNSLPSIPLNSGDLTAGSIITAIVIVLVSLAGAIVGGLAGMRFHRRVDREVLGR